MTEKYKKTFVFCRTLSLLMTIIPILVYIVVGFSEGTIRSKLVLGACLTIALIFVIINILAKHKIRSTIWILMIGLYSACKNIIPLLIIIAVTTVIDEFVLEPLYKKNKEKYIINKEIDLRVENNGREQENNI